MEKIIGLIDAPFTPFYENGEVNYEPIEAYCQLLVKNGLQGVFINGSSGEGYMLTEDERMKLAERWMEVAPQGFKVIVHVGSTCVKSSKRLAEHAQKIGAWGIGAMAPPFPKVGRIEELVKYCEEIACGAPELPFYFYHIPAFNGAFLSMVAFLEAVDGRIPNFAGIKYTFESMYEYNQCRLYKNGKFDMLHGQDETILPCLAMGGAQGGIGGTTNYNGKELVGIIEAWKAGDLELARERQNFAQEVINVICHYRGNIVGGKRIMKLIGLDLGKNRTPFQNMTDEEEAAMKKELWIAVDELPIEQPEAIRKRYQQSMTRKDTGEALGIAAGAVQNLESKAMRTLRMPHKCRKFKPYFEQYLSAQFSSCGEFPKNMDK